MTIPRIILLGYMGAGKTTVGKALAKALNLQFYDLDWYIESRMHMTVKQIFDERGEEGFRKIEHNMHQQGETVYLKATPDVLYGHLKMGRTVRPLLLNKTPDEVKDFVSRQLAEREPFYTKAKHVIDVSLMDNYEKIAITVDNVRRLLDI